MKAIPMKSLRKGPLCNLVPLSIRRIERNRGLENRKV